MARTRSLHAVALCAALAWSGGALAQAPAAQAPAAPTDRCDEARTLFERGSDAVVEGQLAEGRDLLRRAAELCPIVEVRFNLGYALRRAGFTTEAVEVFDALLAEDEASAEQRARIEEELETARGELATLVIRLAPAGTATIEIDGRPAGALQAPELRITTDAGAHVVTARRGRAEARERVELSRGENRQLRLVLVEPTDEGTIPVWVWFTGAAVLVAGAAVAVALLAQSPEPEQVGVLYPTLRWP